MVDVETVMTGLLDEIPALRRRRMPLLITLSVIFFILGLPQVCQVFPEESPNATLRLHRSVPVVKLEHLPCLRHYINECIRMYMYL